MKCRPGRRLTAGGRGVLRRVSSDFQRLAERPGERRGCDETAENDAVEPAVLHDGLSLFGLFIITTSAQGQQSHASLSIGPGRQQGRNSPACRWFRRNGKI